MTPEEKTEAERIKRISDARDREIRAVEIYGISDRRVFDTNGKPIRRKSKSIIEVAQEHGIPLPEWFEETRPAPKK